MSDVIIVDWCSFCRAELCVMILEMDSESIGGLVEIDDLEKEEEEKWGPQMIQQIKCR